MHGVLSNKEACNVIHTLTSHIIVMWGGASALQHQCAGKAGHLLLTESEARLVPPGCEPCVKEHGLEPQVTVWGQSLRFVF